MYTVNIADSPCLWGSSFVKEEAMAVVPNPDSVANNALWSPIVIGYMSADKPPFNVKALDIIFVII